MDRISELAARIQTNTSIVRNYLRAHDLQLPSFDVSAPLTSPIPADATEVIAAREAVVEDTLELNSLMRGPTEQLMSLGATAANDCLGLQAMYRLKLFDHFKPGDETTFEHLASESKINVTDLKRLMRQAMTNHIFEERDNGKVAHTSVSRALRENLMLQNIIGIMTEEMYPSSVKTLDALQRFDGSHAPRETGFALANNPSRGIYEEFLQDTARGRRFAGAMSGFAARTNVDAIAAAHDWSSCKTVVDVGGGWGPVSAALAAKFDGPTFVVQDLPHVVAEGKQHIPEEVRGRLVFESGDAFKHQARNGADVYLLRHVLHNYPDESCSDILRKQAQALSPNSIIFVYDAVRQTHEPKLQLQREKMKRSMDLNMLTFFGARERNLQEWKDIVHAADPGLEIILSEKFPYAQDNVLKITWRKSQ